MTKRITITDVARSAGVSVGTVSRVLNQREGKIRISDATRKHVLDTAEQMGYQANVFASALRTDRTGVIGVIIRNISDPFLSSLTQAIQQAAFVHEIDVLIGHAHDNNQIATRLLQRMRSGWFDGVLLVGKLDGYNHLIDQLRQSKTHFVTVSHGTQAEPPLVNIDEVAGTHLALDHLYQLGHRRIAYIGSMLDAGIGERLAYFKQFALDNDLGLPGNYIQTGVYTQAEAMHRTINLLQRPDSPTAIFAASTWLGIGALQGARYLGVSVPDQLSILGFDEIPQAANTFPPMTTVQQPIDEMAQEVVALLVHQINQDQEVQEVRRIVTPQLIIRASCEEAFAD